MRTEERSYSSEIEPEMRVLMLTIDVGYILCIAAGFVFASQHSYSGKPL